LCYLPFANITFGPSNSNEDHRSVSHRSPMGT
jgi:hypothetical protein